MKRKFSKILGVGLALVLALSLCLVTAVPVGAQDDVPDRVTAITRTADRLVALQGTDGGWDWIVTDRTAHTGSYPSAPNLFGVTALGLIDAYEVTGGMAYFTAAQLTGDHLKTLDRASNPAVRIQSFDYRFLVEFSALSGDPSYAAHALSEWNWVKANVASFYADENQETIYNFWYTSEGDSHGYAAWQAADCGLATLAMGDTSYASDMAAVLAGHLDEIAVDDECRFIGWGHALEFLNAVDPVAYSTDIAGLIANLKGSQKEDGSWGAIEGNPEGIAQDTAYAIMGLAAAGEGGNAQAGAAWLLANQDYGDIVGGWNNSEGGIEYSETDSEALQALASVVPLFLDAPYYEPGDTVTVTVFDFDANTHSAYIDTVDVTAENDLGDFVGWIVLEETEVNSGVFTGSFQTTDQWPAPVGQLYVEDYEELDAEGNVTSFVNDIITVTYGEVPEELTATAAVNNDWPEVTLDLPDELVNNNPIPVDASSITINPEYGLEYASVIFVVSIDALEALAPENVVLIPQLGGIEVVDGNLVGFWGPAVGFGMVTDYEEESKFTAEIVSGPLGTYTVTVDLLDLTFIEEGGATYEGNEYHVLASLSDTFEVVAAEPLMVTVPKDVSVVLDGPSTIDITIQGEDFFGPDGSGDNELDYVDIVVSGPNVSYSLAKAYWTGGSTWKLFEVEGDLELPSAVSGVDNVTISFSVAPNMANEDITVEVTGYTYADPTFTEVGAATETVSVLGYALYNYPTDNVSVGDTASLSLDVKTKDGDIVNSAIVTINANVDAFGKDFDEDGEIEADEKFAQITINEPLNLITYGATGETERYYVNDGYYEVTDITFVDVSKVVIVVKDDPSPTVAALLDPAFGIIGVDVYDVSLDPATVTAGVETDVVVTVTENGDPVTAIDRIKLDSMDAPTTTTSETGEYTIAVPATPEAGTLSVIVIGESGQKHGSTDLAVALPTVDYIIYETVDEEQVERNVMLVGAAYDYTIAITVTDALGEPLESGYVWLGTYDADEETFAKLTGVTTLPITLEDGLGDIVITQTSENGELLEARTLVWKVGSGEAPANAALLPTPTITVQTPVYTLTWVHEAPIVDEEVTFTVTNNYGEGIGDIDIQIVSPGGVLTERVTTPTGNFKYTATEDGDYYVSVGEQDPVTVTVVVTRLVSIAAPESVSLYVELTEQLIITATYEDGTDDEVTATATYVSSDESVATVDAGLITAVTAGEATITVSYTEGVIDVTTTVSVTVSEVPVLVSITASLESVSLYLDETQLLTITATYTDLSKPDVTADATYVSSDESVATVDAGLITAVTAGDATITVSYETETAYVSVTVTVVEPVAWSCPIDHVALIAPFPANDRALLTESADLSEVDCDADWFQVLWLDEETGEWKWFLSGVEGSTLLTLEPGQYYYVIVDAPCEVTISQ